MRAKIIQFKSCLECPDSGHSGAFTPGGAWMVCSNNDVCYKRPGVAPEDWMARRLPVHPGTRDYDGTFPDFCPYQDVQGQVADQLPEKEASTKAHFILIVTMGGLVDFVQSYGSRREAEESMKMAYVFTCGKDEDFDAWVYKIYPSSGDNCPNGEFVSNARQVLDLD